MAAFEPVLSRNFNVALGHTLKVYESKGGYQAARKALASDPDSVVIAGEADQAAPLLIARHRVIEVRATCWHCPRVVRGDRDRMRGL